MPRPCPYVGCRHNLYLTVSEAGSIRLTRDVEPWEVVDSCALDVAAKGGQTQDEVAAILNVTRFGLQLCERELKQKVGHCMPRGICQSWDEE